MKDALKYLVIGTGGFVGANTRYIVGGWVQQKWGTSFPYGTFVINVSGSFILGLFGTLAIRYAWDDYWRFLIAIGFVGAYSTFSTFEYETIQLIAEGGRYKAAAINLVGSVVVGFIAAYLGVVFARLLMRGKI
jgi:CrcB protein